MTTTLSVGCMRPPQCLWPRRASVRGLFNSRLQGVPAPRAGSMAGSTASQDDTVATSNTAGNKAVVSQKAQEDEENSSDEESQEVLSTAKIACICWSMGMCLGAILIVAFPGNDLPITKVLLSYVFAEPIKATVGFLVALEVVTRRFIWGGFSIFLHTFWGVVFANGVCGSLTLLKSQKYLASIAVTRNVYLGSFVCVLIIGVIAEIIFNWKV